MVASQRGQGDCNERVIEAPVCAPVLAPARPRALHSLARRPRGHGQPESASPAAAAAQLLPGERGQGPRREQEWEEGGPRREFWAEAPPESASPPGPGRPMTAPRVVSG